MKRKRAKRLLAVFLFLILSVVAAAGGLAWRLSQGPMSVNFLASYIEDALSASDGAYTITVRDTVVQWDGWERGVQIHARDIRAVRPSGKVLATFPAMSVHFSARALVSGEVALSRIDLYRPRLRLVRGPDGEVTFGVERAKEEDSHFMPGFLDALSRPGENRGPFHSLRSIQIVDGHLTIVDGTLGRQWDAPNVNMSLSRDAAGVRAKAAMAITIGKQRIHLDVRGIYSRITGTGRVTLVFNELDPALFVSATGRLTALKHLKIPLSGTITVSLAGRGKVSAAEFAFTGGPGRLILPRYYNADLRIWSLSTRGRFSNGMRRIELREFKIELDGPVVNVVGLVESTGTTVSYKGTTTVSEIALKDFARFWPNQLKGSARSWVTRNIKGGRVSDMEIRLALQVINKEETTVKLDVLHGTFKYERMSVRFQEHLPPVRGVGGTATFTDKDLKFVVDKGNIEGVTLMGAKVEIRGFDAPIDFLTVDARAKGKLGDILSIVDHKPFRYAQKLGVSPLAVKGRAITRLKVVLPLFKTLSLDQVTIEAQSKLTDLSWRKGLFGLDIAKGNLLLTLDKTGMQVKGTGTIGGAPGHIGWQENFADKVPFRRKFTVKAPFATAVLAKMGLRVDQLLSGSFTTSFTVTGRDDGKNFIDAAFNLRRTGFVIPILRLTKEPGTPGRARINVTMNGHRVESINRFTLRAGDIRAAGRVSFHKDGKTIKDLAIDKLIAKRTNLKLRIRGDVLGNKRAMVVGDSLDLTPILKNKTDSGEVKLLPLAARGRLSRLYFAPDRYIADFTGEANYDGTIWRRIMLNGNVGTGKTVTIQLIAAGKQRRLDVRANDAGAALRALNIVDTIKGGRLSVTATKNDGKPGSGFVGRTVVTGFRVINAPVMARVLALASLGGLGNLMSSDRGVEFANFVVPFRYKDGIIRVAKGRSVGSEIGITFSGALNFHKDRARIKGTIVPAYTLNRVIAHVPIIGKALVGEHGSGLLAATYSVKGPLARPTVSVNPLTVLTPGFLRYLLSESPDDLEGKRPAPQAPPPILENRIGR